jgi:hypothetical protein
MYQRLRTIQTRFLFWIICAFVGFGVGQIIAQSHYYNDKMSAYEQDLKETHFFRVIAGVEFGTAPTVDNLLARDLQKILHDPAAIDSFRGNSNRYGGVSETIGYDPFDETGLNCFECGPLDSFTRNVLSNIASGNRSDLEVQHQKPVEGYKLTPFGVPVWTVLGFIWIVGGPLSLFGAQMWTGRRHVDWTLESPDIMIIKTLAFPYFGYRWVTQKHRDTRRERKVREAFPDHMRVIDQIDKTLTHVPNDEMKFSLQERRDRTMLELTKQALSGEEGSDQLKDLIEQLESTDEFLKARLAAKEEMQ